MQLQLYYSTPIHWCDVYIIVHVWQRLVRYMVISTVVWSEWTKTGHGYCVLSRQDSSGEQVSALHRYFISQTVGSSLSVENVKQPQRLLVRPPAKDLHLLLIVLPLILILPVIAIVCVRLVLWGDTWLTEPGKVQAAQRFDVARQQLCCALRHLLTVLWSVSLEQRGRRGESRRRRPREETETLQFEKTLVPT